LAKETALDGDPAPHRNWYSRPPLLARVYCGQTAGWIRIPLGRGRHRPRPCSRWGPSSHFLAHFALVCSPISATAELLSVLVSVGVNRLSFCYTCHHISTSLRALRCVFFCSRWPVLGLAYYSPPSLGPNFQNILSLS